jgi:DNA-binding transcriptional MerR regulator
MVRIGIQIGRVSEQTGLSNNAIRFREKQRLLDHPPRTEGGFRLYNAQDIERIQCIRRAERLAFSLAEIRDPVAIDCSHTHPLRYILDMLFEATLQWGRELRLVEALIQARPAPRGANPAMFTAPRCTTP